MKRIYSAQNTLMVDHLKHVLDAEGIGCVVRNRFLAGAAGRLPPTECWTELWVLDEARLADARRLLHRAFAEQDSARGEWWSARAAENGWSHSLRPAGSALLCVLQAPKT